MPFENLNNRHLDAAQKTAISDAINELRTLTQPLAVSLSAEERRRYGSINEANKGIVNKAKSFNDSLPALSAPDVDWTEFNNDYAMREFIENSMQALMGIYNDLFNSKILFDFDNFTAANKDYAYTKYKMKGGEAGYQGKYDEMRQFYDRPGLSPNPNDQEEG
jgi:hypothetical protein